MNYYSIKELENLSGIKSHTIRIWEQRYGLLKPQRTQTNIRKYSDDDLKKILNVSLLVSSGMKISKICDLSETEINTFLETITEYNDVLDFHEQQHINQLMLAGLQYNETDFDKTFGNAVLKYGLEQTYLNIIYPLLVKVGMMWSKNELMPAQEHFISNLIKQKLFSAIDALPSPRESATLWLLFLSEKEEHEIGLLLANYIIRSKGHKVIYMGQKVPIENIENVVKACSPNYLYTFFVTSSTDEKINSFLIDLKKIGAGATILVSGKKNNLESIVQKHKIKLLLELSDLIKELK